MRATYQDIINRLDEIERHALRALGSGQEDTAHQVQLIITNAHARVSYGAWRRDGTGRSANPLRLSRSRRASDRSIGRIADEERVTDVDGGRSSTPKSTFRW